MCCWLLGWRGLHGKVVQAAPQEQMADGVPLARFARGRAWSRRDLQYVFLDDPATHCEQMRKQRTKARQRCQDARVKLMNRARVNSDGIALCKVRAVRTMRSQQHLATSCGQHRPTDAAAHSTDRRCARAAGRRLDTHCGCDGGRSTRRARARATHHGRAPCCTPKYTAER